MTGEFTMMELAETVKEVCPFFIILNVSVQHCLCKQLFYHCSDYFWNFRAQYSCGTALWGRPKTKISVLKDYCGCQSKDLWVIGTCPYESNLTGSWYSLCITPNNGSCGMRHAIYIKSHQISKFHKCATCTEAKGFDCLDIWTLDVFPK